MSPATSIANFNRFPIVFDRIHCTCPSPIPVGYVGIAVVSSTNKTMTTKTAKPTVFKISDAVSSVQKFDYRLPMKFGNRIVDDVSLQRVTVVLEEKGKKRKGLGIGEMTLGTSWAWPSRTISGEQTLRIVSGLVNELLKLIPENDFVGHHLFFCMRIN